MSFISTFIEVELTLAENDQANYITWAYRL